MPADTGIHTQKIFGYPWQRNYLATRITDGVWYSVVAYTRKGAVRKLDRRMQLKGTSP